MRSVLAARLHLVKQLSELLRNRFLDGMAVEGPQFAPQARTTGGSFPATFLASASSQVIRPVIDHLKKHVAVGRARGRVTVSSSFQRLNERKVQKFSHMKRMTDGMPSLILTLSQ
jgi:hypothetical protein